MLHQSHENTLLGLVLQARGQVLLLNCPSPSWPPPPLQSQAAKVAALMQSIHKDMMKKEKEAALLLGKAVTYAGLHLTSTFFFYLPA